MRYRRFGDTYMIRIDIGEEIMESLAAVCEKEKIRLGQVSAIGAVNHAKIGVFDLLQQVYHREELNEFMEITTLAGSVTELNGKPLVHLHTTLAAQDHTIHGGHVIEMHVGATCEVFLRVLDGKVSREKDPDLGINLWTFGEGE